MITTAFGIAAIPTSAPWAPADLLLVAVDREVTLWGPGEPALNGDLRRQVVVTWTTLDKHVVRWCADDRGVTARTHHVNGRPLTSVPVAGPILDELTVMARQAIADLAIAEASR